MLKGTIIGYNYNRGILKNVTPLKGEVIRSNLKVGLIKEN
jgi:hypothetical protein